LRRAPSRLRPSLENDSGKVTSSEIWQQDWANIRQVDGLPTASN
jgi:hypothetical protein